MLETFKIGIGSYAYRWTVSLQNLSPSDLLNRAAAVGSQVVQLCDNLNTDQLPSSTLRSLARQAADLNLSLELGIKGGQPDHIRHSLDAADALGTHLLRAVVADEDWSPNPDELIEILRNLLPDLQARGTALALENHFDLTPAQLGKVVETVNSPLVGICLDPINAISQLIGQEEVVAHLARHALSVHIKDAQARQWKTGFYVSGVPMGTGRLNLDALLAALRAAGRYPAVLLESWMDPLENDQATCVQEEVWVRDSLDYLRRAVSPGAANVGAA